MTGNGWVSDTEPWWMQESREAMEKLSRPDKVIDRCSFALGRGRYCPGDTRFPATHATLCPHYAAPADVVLRPD